MFTHISVKSYFLSFSLKNYQHNFESYLIFPVLTIPHVIRMQLLIEVINKSAEKYSLFDIFLPSDKETLIRIRYYFFKPSPLKCEPAVCYAIFPYCTKHQDVSVVKRLTSDITIVQGTPIWGLLSCSY